MVFLTGKIVVKLQDLVFSFCKGFFSTALLLPLESNWMFFSMQHCDIVVNVSINW